MNCGKSAMLPPHPASEEVEQTSVIALIEIRENPQPNYLYSATLSRTRPDSIYERTVWILLDLTVLARIYGVRKVGSLQRKYILKLC